MPSPGAVTLVGATVTQLSYWCWDNLPCPRAVPRAPAVWCYSLKKSSSELDRCCVGVRDHERFGVRIREVLVLPQQF